MARALYSGRMVLEWLSGSEGSVEGLIVRKKYKKAIEVLRAEFQKGSRDPRLRQQLADVLILAGRSREAIPILAGLGDELARSGFAAKAIAILKRIEKIEPGRADVARKLAALIEAREPAPAAAGPPQDFREIGISLPTRAAPPVSTWAPSAAPAAAADEPALPPVALPLPPPEAPVVEATPVEAEPLDDDLDLSLDTLVPGGPTSGEAVRSPLFSDFSAGELLAVMGGLQLLSFEAGRDHHHRGRAGQQLVRGEHGPGEGLRAEPGGTARPGAGDG